MDTSFRNLKKQMIKPSTRIFRAVVLTSLLSRLIACQGKESTKELVSNELLATPSNSNTRPVKVTATIDSILKRQTTNSSMQADEDLCNIPQGSSLQGAVEHAADGHLKFYLKTGENIEGCAFTVGYIFAGHFNVEYLDGRGPGGHPNATMAMLAVIAHAEGTNDRYDLIFGYRTFQSYNDHPRITVCSGGYCSTAAGRYQFLEPTWDETRRATGLRDFSPPSQDRAAIYRMETFRGMREHSQVLNRAAFERAIYKINREWASLPGSPYGQPTKPMSTLWNVYQQKL
jgi:muramidase (phage lysozyme)